MMRLWSNKNWGFLFCMIKCIWIMKLGKVWVGYYYDGWDVEGRCREILLGMDLDEVWEKWVKLERKVVLLIIWIVGDLLCRFEWDVVLMKVLKIQKEYLKMIC